MATLAIALLSSIALVKPGAEIVADLQSGPSLEQARQQVGAQLPSAGCVVVDERSWALLDDVRRGREELDRRPVPDLTRGCDTPLVALLMPPAGAPCAPLMAPPGNTTPGVGTRPARPATLLGRSVSAFPSGYSFCAAALSGGDR